VYEIINSEIAGNSSAGVFIVISTAMTIEENRSILQAILMATRGSSEREKATGEDYETVHI
jgi:hypothetical protein